MHLEISLRLIAALMLGHHERLPNTVLQTCHRQRSTYPARLGGAADFCIDESPADGRMDDLNRDGRVDRNDARWLANFINDMSRRGAFGPRVDGLGVYGSTAAHGPFVRVDVRGTQARW